MKTQKAIILTILYIFFIEFVAVWVLKLLFFPEAGPGSLLIAIFILLVVFSPLFYALSKIIWANFFIKYDKSISKKKVVDLQHDTGSKK